MLSSDGINRCGVREMGTLPAEEQWNGLNMDQLTLS